MIRAAIDVGSNSVRMLLLPSDKKNAAYPQYFRQVTRLAGDFQPKSGLAPQSMARTLETLAQFAVLLKKNRVEKVKAVGTAVLRQAVNSVDFVERVRIQTGLKIEVIDGDTEAELSCRGLLSVLNPIPERALLFDIGGGSTEIILFENAKILFQKSFPLGVVRLFEDYPDPDKCFEVILQVIASFVNSPVWQKWQYAEVPIELVGTAGTVTTLAALKLKMVKYDGRLVNNLILERCWLEDMCRILPELSLEDRAALPGMEEGRADVILPGLQIVSVLINAVGSSSLRVADAGLLEGLLLE